MLLQHCCEILDIPLNHFCKMIYDIYWLWQEPFIKYKDTREEEKTVSLFNQKQNSLWQFYFCLLAILGMSIKYQKFVDGTISSVDSASIVAAFCQNFHWRFKSNRVPFRTANIATGFEFSFWTLRNINSQRLQYKIGTWYQSVYIFISSLSFGVSSLLWINQFWI